MDYSTIFNKVKDSVLDISIIDGERIQIMGSGVLIGDGTIALTCAHCVDPDLKVLAKFSESSSGFLGQARKIFDMDSKERIGVVYNPAS